MIYPVLLSGLLALLECVHGDVIVYTTTAPHTIAQEFVDIQGSFGGDLPLEGLRGLLQVGEPSDGCAPLAPPPPNEDYPGKWFVLIARYNCSFEVKVRNAQAAGYACAIVHNVNSSDLETMSAKDPEGITIPSVFVRECAGIALAEQYAFPNSYYIMVNGDMPFNINTHLLLPFAIVVVLCLVVILIFMIVKCIKDRRRARRHRLPNRALAKIPTCKFCKGDPYDTCAICLDDYQEGERLRVLPCAHAYHMKCIDPWLTRSRRVCPVCKRRVVTAGERRRPAPASASASDSDTDDTEPLVGASRQHTQGGTFEERSENPFVYAARMMAQLRRARQPAADNEEAPAAAAEENETENGNDENADADADDTAPLLVRAESERAPRRTRRSRATTSAPATPPVHAASPAPHTPATPPAATAPALSINTDMPQIGVAALPVSQSSSTPPHVNL